MSFTLLPESISIPLRTSEDSIARKLPRIHLSHFHVLGAQIGEDAKGCFVLGIAQEPPTIKDSISFAAAIRRIDERPIAIAWNGMDSRMMRELESEGIGSIKNSGTYCLPWLGIKVSSEEEPHPPQKLSPQAQRIFLNLVSGQWTGKSAGELSSLCGKSRASISTYLAEICAIAPDLVEKQGVRRLLRNPGHETEELLDTFWPYLSSPVTRRIRLARHLSIDTLRNAGALVSGESALSFVSDLAPDDSRLTIAVNRTSLPRLQEACGAEWIEATWYEPCPLEIEVWAYPIDKPSDISFLATGLSSIDLLNLYVACSRAPSDDIRYQDALSQLREKIR